MAGYTPLETVEQLVDAFQRGDVDAAMALYESKSTLVVEPGTVANTPEALREATAGFIALKPTLTTESHEVFEAGDLALYCSRWRLTGTAPDGSLVHEEGLSTDVLRRTPEGTWLIAIDNPWGHAILAPQGA